MTSNPGLAQRKCGCNGWVPAKIPADMPMWMCSIDAEMVFGGDRGPELDQVGQFLVTLHIQEIYLCNFPRIR